MIETLFCTIDQKPIPEARAVRNSNTCSKGCAKKLRAIRRARANERACQVCGKPSTPQQRASYRRWLASNPATAPRKRGRPARAENPPAPTLEELCRHADERALRMASVAISKGYVVKNRYDERRVPYLASAEDLKMADYVVAESA